MLNLLAGSLHTPYPNLELLPHAACTRYRTPSMLPRQHQTIPAAHPWRTPRTTASLHATAHFVRILDTLPLAHFVRASACACLWRTCAHSARILGMLPNSAHYRFIVRTMRASLPHFSRTKCSRLWRTKCASKPAHHPIRASASRIPFPHTPLPQFQLMTPSNHPLTPLPGQGIL